NRRLVLFGAFHVVFACGFAVVSDANSTGELFVLGEAHGHAKMNIAILELQHVVGINVSRKPIASVDVLSVAFKVWKLLFADFRYGLPFYFDYLEVLIV